MNSDNDAARAGLDEVSGHIQVLTARIAQLQDKGKVSSDAMSPIEDLQDWYDRAVQLRTMRITTLESEKAEMESRIMAVSSHAIRLRRVLLLFILMLIASIAEYVSPGSTNRFVSAYWSHIAMSAAVATLVKQFS